MMELEVRHIIVPRVDVSFLSRAESSDENLARIRGSQHSRLPLCETGLDTVVGIVHTKDVLAAALDNETPDLASLSRDAVFVTDTMAVSDFLRELQRTYDLAVVLVHHASKRQRAQPGQGLRGSSDLHAFGDSNAYLARRQDHLVLSLEHRSAPAPAPLALDLVSLDDGSATHLALRADIYRISYYVQKTTY